jgi:ribonuclease G
VQIAKEPISSKGPRLTSEISIAGRNMVLLPFSDKISVSQKIQSNEEKIRLKKLIQSIRPRNYGIIVRTAAEDKKVAELDQEIKRWLKGGSLSL